MLEFLSGALGVDAEGSYPSLSREENEGLIGRGEADQVHAAFPIGRTYRTAHRRHR